MIHLPTASPPLSDLCICSSSTLPLLILSRSIFFLFFPPFPPLSLAVALSLAPSNDTMRGGEIHGYDCQINYSFCAITLTQRSFPVLWVVIKLTAIPAARRHQPNRIFMEAAGGMADLH